MTLYEEIKEMVKVKQETAKTFVSMFGRMLTLVSQSEQIDLESGEECVNDGMGNNRIRIILESSDNYVQKMYAFDFNFEAISRDEVAVEMHGFNPENIIFKENVKIDSMENMSSSGYHIFDAIKREIKFGI